MTLTAHDIENVQAAIDEGFNTIALAALLTGTPGAPGMYADDAELERAADAVVRMRAKMTGMVIR